MDEFGRTLENAAAWTLLQGRFITSLQLCDQFNISLTIAGRLIRKLITHPRITAESKRERCIISGGQAKMMVMVRITQVVKAPLGPLKPSGFRKPKATPCKPKAVKLPSPKDAAVLEIR
ncbi:hypothetical protein [Aeromonas hydrophila]